jgi:hypothetical protein
VFIVHTRETRQSTNIRRRRIRRKLRTTPPTT